MRFPFSSRGEWHWMHSATSWTRYRPRSTTGPPAEGAGSAGAAGRDAARAADRNAANAAIEIPAAAKAPKIFMIPSRAQDRSRAGIGRAARNAPSDHLEQVPHL